MKVDIWVLVVFITVFIFAVILILRYIKKIKQFDVTITFGPTREHLSRLYEGRPKEHQPDYKDMSFLDCGVESRFVIKRGSFVEDLGGHSFFEVINLKDILLKKTNRARVRLTKGLSHDVCSRTDNRVLFLDSYFIFEFEYDVESKKGTGIKYFSKKYNSTQNVFPW